MERIYRGFKTKAVKETGEFEGYGAVYDTLDRQGEVIEKGCFRESVELMKQTGQMPTMLWCHKSEEPIGEWKSMTEDENGLYVHGQLWIGKGIARAEQAYLMLKSNGCRGMSIGALTKPGDATYEGGVLKIRKAELLECSLTPMPANPRAKVSIVKSISVLRPREAEEILRDAGFSHSEAKAFVVALRKGLETRDESSAELVNMLRQLHTTISG